MSDRREEILNPKKYGLDSDQASAVLNAMDEYMRETCLELLEYMAKKRIISSHDEKGAYFLTRGETLTKEQVFENFI